MGATEVGREAAAVTAVTVVMIVEISIAVVADYALALGLRVMTDTTDPVVADPAVMKTDLVIGTLVVIETEAEDAPRAPNVLEANLQPLNLQKTNGIVVQFSSNSLLRV
jgi:hypothetical protein